MPKAKKTKTAKQPVPQRFILWNPNSDRPPRKIFTTREEAENVAQLCAPKYNGTVHVCQLVSTATPPTREVLVIENPGTFTRND